MRKSLLFAGALAAAVLSGVSVSSVAFAAEQVAFAPWIPNGVIFVRTNERSLYLTVGPGRAIRYSVGVGRVGRQWSGTSFIDGKFVRPNWAPPDAVRHDNPKLPKVIAGGAASNPMGAAAMTLSGGEYAIHGTNAPKSIGGFVSYGCIRMYNADILDLYGRVAIGTTVVVAP